jgi:hypothetical protein
MHARNKEEEGKKTQEERRRNKHKWGGTLFEA